MEAEHTTDQFPPRSNTNDQLFNVVYDPQYDRFFLEDETLHRERSQKLDLKGISMPWDQWIVPPMPAPNADQEPIKKENSCLRDADHDHKVDSVPLLTNKVTQEFPVIARQSQIGQPTLVPALDFSSFQPEISAIEPAATIKPKKARVQNYTAHFKKMNQDMARVIAAGAMNALPSDDHEVKWNGEVIHVQFPGLQPEYERSAGRAGVRHDALETEAVHSATDQWAGSTYELKDLMRIRAHADGLRGVNSACRFVAVSSSESSDSEEEQENIPQQESEDESDLMPVFFRDDRVLFHARRCWFKGTVRRRIPSSDFYNVRADNGTLFEAVLASKMELLDEPEELPYYHYRRGDKVLWVPECKDTTPHNSRSTTTRRSRRQRESNNSDEELTYKAKIVQMHSLNQFDLLLRTGRVVKRVPHEQLRPRDASDFVSSTVSRRR